MQALGAMVCASIRQSVGADDPRFIGSNRTISACEEAELYYMRTLRSLALFCQSGAIHDRFRIVADRQGRSLLLQKAAGERSALTLRRITIDGIPYPPGSIVRLGITGEYDNSLAKSRVSFTYHDHVEYVAFQRVSEFTLPPEKRLVNTVLASFHDQEDAKRMQYLTVDTFTRFADQAVQIAGVDRRLFSSF
jgi:hypothetical protein